MNELTRHIQMKSCGGCYLLMILC